MIPIQKIIKRRRLNKAQRKPVARRNLPLPQRQLLLRRNSIPFQFGLTALRLEVHGVFIGVNPKLHGRHSQLVFSAQRAPLKDRLANGVCCGATASWSAGSPRPISKGMRRSESLPKCSRNKRLHSSIVRPACESGIRPGGTVHDEGHSDTYSSLTTSLTTHFVAGEIWRIQRQRLPLLTQSPA